MAQSVIQTSFNSGEWAPALNARVDLTKYHSAAALLRNFFVDYRGGATTRPGTRFITRTGGNVVRLLPFQAATGVSYILEFGEQYIRFVSNGQQILSGGVPYQISTFYHASELAQLKFVQNINTLVICHPNHPPALLTLVSQTNWTFAAITFGSAVTAPTGLQISGSTLPAGPVTYAYQVTSVDVNGQESAPTGYVQLAGHADFRTTPGTNVLAWNPVAGAASYNVYRAPLSYVPVVFGGMPSGFIGNATSAGFQDTNINADFSQTPPLVSTPNLGSSVVQTTITNSGLYNNVTPNVAFSAPPAGGVQATGVAVMAVGNLGTPVQFVNFGSQNKLGDTLTFTGNVTGLVTTDGVNLLLAFISGGSIIGPVPNVLVQIGSTGNGSGAVIGPLQWSVQSISITNSGSGYLANPTVTFDPGVITATANAIIGGNSSNTVTAPSFTGTPTVPTFWQQRLYLMGMTGNPQQVCGSQPGSPYNFNVSNPAQADDAVFESLAANVLNTIKSGIAVPAGLLVLTDQQLWLLNGGSPGTAATALNFVANSQAYDGAGDLPPIVSNYDVLYVQSLGSIVRNASYNFYTNVYAGADISILSSHLFYGFTLKEWAYAKEPFKLIWAVRNDGQLLSLTFVKEQELIAWAHHDTNGTYQSIATVTESTPVGLVNAVYVAVSRVINGAAVTYIERFVELNYPLDYKSAWQVDAGIGYIGSPATTFSGASHLANMPVTGVADGVVINFTMPVSGTFVFGPGGTPGLTAIPNASVVTVGLAFTPQLQTLRLDLGEPTVQGKPKSVAGVTVRIKDTLGLSIGRSFSSLVAMKDLVLGNVGTMSNKVVTGLVTDDAYTKVDPLWDIPGQYCIQQSNPYPASILGVIPEIVVGDSR